MLECNLSGRRVVSVSEVYHKWPPGRDRPSRHTHPSRQQSRRVLLRVRGGDGEGRTPPETRNPSIAGCPSHGDLATSGLWQVQLDSLSVRGTIPQICNKQVICKVTGRLPGSTYWRGRSSAPGRLRQRRTGVQPAVGHNAGP